MNFKFSIKVFGLALAGLMILVACQQTTSQTTELQPNDPETIAAARSFIEEPIQIIVSGLTPQEIASRTARLDRAGMANLLLELKLADNGTLLAKDAMQSVIYVHLGDVPVGSNLQTSYTYTRSTSSKASQPTDRPFTERFDQIMSSSTPTKPIVIINGAFSIFKGTFDFELREEGKTLVKRRIIVPSDK